MSQAAQQPDPPGPEGPIISIMLREACESGLFLETMLTGRGTTGWTRILRECRRGFRAK